MFEDFKLKLNNVEYTVQVPRRNNAGRPVVMPDSPHFKSLSEWLHEQEKVFNYIDMKSFSAKCQDFGICDEKVILNFIFLL